MTIPKSQYRLPSYENFEAECPHCHKLSIFNRATDLKTFHLITDATVSCQNPSCMNQFRIGGDFINPAWQMVLLDCEILKNMKRYSYCILNLCQAFEMFFALFLRVTFVYKPFCIEKQLDLPAFNRISQLLYKTTRDWTFGKLRKVFLNLLCEQVSCKTLAESESIVLVLDKYSVSLPEDDTITKLADSKLVELLVELKSSQVSVLRNDVVHKTAYRPTLEEVEKEIDEATHLLHGLNHCLGVLSEEPYVYGNS